MCEDEFNSIFDQEPMYVQRISDGSTIGKFMISMTNNFRVFYLMPVPDFFLTEETPALINQLATESTEVATFQSLTRIVGTRCFTGKITVPTGSSSGGLLLDTSSDYNSVLIDAKLDVALLFDQDLSTGDNAFCVNLSWEAQTGEAPAVADDQVISLLVSDYNTNSYSASGEFCWSSYAHDTLWINFQCINGVADRDLTFAYVVHISPFGSAICQTNPQNILAEGYVAINNTSPIVITPDNVLEVFVTNNSGDPIPVINDNTFPLSVTVDNDMTDPIPVQIVNQVSVLVENPDPLSVSVDAPDPLPVSFSTSSPLEITGRVQGVLAPDTPVFVSSYFSV